MHEAGELLAAEHAYQQIGSDHPDYPKGLLGLATVHLQRGAPAQALALVERALALRPGEAEVHATHGAVLHTLRRHADAAAAYERALAINTDSAECYFGLGTALQALGRHEEALACLERALIMDDDYPEAECARGVSLTALNRVADAEQAFATAVSLDPDYVEARCGYGNALLSSGERGTARTQFERALELAPDHIPALTSMAKLLQEENDGAEAVARLRQAVAIKSNDPALMLALGSALEQIGQLAEGEALFERAVSIASAPASALYALFQARRACADDPMVARLLRLAEDPLSLSTEDQVLLHFTLGKVLPELGRPDEGFAHLLEGNALRRSGIHYHESSVLEMLADIHDVMSGPFMSSVLPHRSFAAPTPVFIVGMPRSGSSLIEQILASHPDVAGGGERGDLYAAMRAIGLEGADVASHYPYAVPSLDSEAIRSLGEEYRKRAREACGERRFITDKTPANFALLGLVRMALPEARVIHSVRDPVDTCLSCFATLFTQDQPFTFDLAELGRYYASYEALMAHWRRVLPGDFVLDVHYADLVDDLETQARQMLAHCGLPWTAVVLDFPSNDRTVRTASLRQVRQPVYTTSLQRWRPESHLLRPLLEGLRLFQPLSRGSEALPTR